MSINSPKKLRTNYLSKWGLFLLIHANIKITNLLTQALYSTEFLRALEKTMEWLNKINRKEDIMNCEKLRNLLDKSNEMAANNLWNKETYVINMKIWAADNNNFTACTRLAQYYKFNDNIPDAKKMYLNALEIYPNNFVVKSNLIEIERLHEETKFIDDLTTSRECYNSGRSLTQKGHHWLAGECYLKAYSMEPLLEYGVSLARSYGKLGKYNKIKRLYKELMDNGTSHDMIENIKVEFVELLNCMKSEQKKVNTA